MTAPQVRREWIPVIAEPAKIDDRGDACSARSRPESPGCIPVRVRKRLRRTHGMDKVVGRIAAMQRAYKRSFVFHVAFNDLYTLIKAAAQTLRCPGKTTHLVTALTQARDEPATDIAGGSGNEHAHYLLSVHSQKA